MARRRHKKQQLSARIGEGATVERCHQQGGIVKEVVDRDADGTVVMLRSRARCECILDAYIIRGLITIKEHEAGMKFRKAWLRARCGIQVSDRRNSGLPLSFEEALNFVSNCERMLQKARDSLTPAQRRVIMRVCCDDKQAGGSDALETLRRALENLIECWKAEKADDHHV